MVPHHTLIVYTISVSWCIITLSNFHGFTLSAYCSALSHLHTLTLSQFYTCIITLWHISTISKLWHSVILSHNQTYTSSPTSISWGIITLSQFTLLAYRSALLHFQTFKLSQFCTTSIPTSTTSIYACSWWVSKCYDAPQYAGSVKLWCIITLSDFQTFTFSQVQTITFDLAHLVDWKWIMH